MKIAVKPGQDEPTKSDFDKIIRTEKGYILKQARVLVIIGEYADDVQFGGDVKKWVDSNFKAHELTFSEVKPLDYYEFRNKRISERGYKPTKEIDAEFYAEYFKNLEEAVGKAKAVGADVIISLKTGSQAPKTIHPGFSQDVELYSQICEEQKSHLGELLLDTYPLSEYKKGREKLIDELRKLHYAELRVGKLEKNYETQVREAGMALMNIQAFFTEM